MAENLVKKIEAVKIGLEVFGVEKRIKALENAPRSSGGGGRGGNVDISGLLKLDQTTPQTVENGSPTFEGIKIKSGYKLILDA